MEHKIVNSSSRNRNIRAVDLRRPSKFTRDQMRQVEHAHTQFCRTATSRLSAELRTEFELVWMGLEQIPYSEGPLEELPAETMALLVEIAPAGTRVGLVMEFDFAMSAINHTLGGGEVPFDITDEDGGFTDLEMVVVRRAMDGLIDSLSDTWTDLAEVRLRATGAETAPASVQLAPPSEPTLVLRMRAIMDEKATDLALCMPHASVAGFIERLEYAADGRGEDAKWRPIVRSAVGRVPVDVRATAGEVDLPLAMIAGLEPGQSVRLREPVSRGVTVHVGEVPAWKAEPGSHEHYRAVKMGGRIKEHSS